MKQTDRGNYRTNESMFHTLSHSCLGRIVIFGAVCAVILFLAHISVPDKETMTEEMNDNIRQCITANDSIKGDWIDDAVNNIGYTFTHADSTFDEKVWETFNKYNWTEYHHHAFYSTMYLHNNYRPQGTRAGIGIFGMVLPTVNFNDIILRVAPIHKGYDKRIMQNIYYEDQYMGENPNVKEYHYKGDVTE